MAALAEDAPAAARAGELTVYLSVPAVLIYLVLGNRFGGRAKGGH